MSYVKAKNPAHQLMYDYLEVLRQSGKTNMYGATPYLQQDFGLTKAEAMAILIGWIDAHPDPKTIPRL